MHLSRRITIPVLTLLFSALACATPVASTPAPDLNLLNTAVAQTVNAASTLSIVPGSPLPADSSTSTFTPETSSLIPTETSTPTAVFTFTPLIPLISVSIATNCRSGPGKLYDYRGALLVGMSAEILARDPGGEYWLIRNPDSEGDPCWVWGNYATISGNILNLPVQNPPPSPTPTFTPSPTVTLTPVPFFKASLSGLESCEKSWWVNIKLKNNGAVTFKSYEITIKDRTTDETLTDFSNGFTNIDGCLKRNTKSSIAPKEIYLLSAPAFSHKLSGHGLHVVLTLCSEARQRGICATEKFELSP